MTITVTVNGEHRQVADGTSVREIVASVASPDESSHGDGVGIAVALDDEVLPRADWSRPVAHGSRIEVLTAVQGG